jgi:hypothetical protein
LLMKRTLKQWEEKYENNDDDNYFSLNGFNGKK